jgi:putative (di)nucleoside polyphosphate hydrolase
VSAADTILSLQGHLDDAQIDFLKLEYGNLTQALINNEELGERRLTIFVGLIGAATAGVGLAAETLKDDPQVLLGAIAALTGGLLLLGLATLRRVMERNLSSTAFLNGIGLVRAAFIARSPAAVALFPYVPDLPPRPRSKQGWGMGKAGLLETVALANCALVVACASAATALSGLPLGAAIILGGLTGLGAWFGQLIWARSIYRRDDLGQRRAKAIAEWRIAMERGEDLGQRRAEANRGVAIERGETFRAGVGIAVTRSDGKVLVLERLDTPGAWQLPQGGLNAGEGSEAAAWRELREEVGLTERLGDLVAVTQAWFGYELPPEYQKPKTGRGQVHQWFHVRLREDSDMPELPAGPGAEFRTSHWVTPTEALSGAVDFRKAEYRAALTALDLLTEQVD